MFFQKRNAADEGGSNKTKLKFSQFLFLTDNELKKRFVLFLKFKSTFTKHPNRKTTVCATSHKTCLFQLVQPIKRQPTTINTSPYRYEGNQTRTISQLAEKNEIVESSGQEQSRVHGQKTGGPGTVR